ncbi:MAG: PEP-CTERM sorting domain-containing protein [Burkholderiales bacterium]|nr:PEP-CTERM sorting domain-containing protein [Burkholderiales bacterium]
MRSNLKYVCANSLAAAALVLLANAASAQADTHSLDGWNAVGDAIAAQGAITVTTAYLDGAGDEPYNLSGHSAVDIALVEDAAGLAPYALDLPYPDYATEGSLVSQSFAVQAGQTLSFDWSFTTHEDRFEDHAWAVVDGRLYALATRSQGGAALNHFSYTYAGSGMTTLALGVVDTGDVLGVSALTISQLAVSAVPEPALPVLLLAGLLPLFVVARRRAQSPTWR